MLYLLKPDRYKKVFYGFAVLGVLLLGYVASEEFWKRMGTIVVEQEEERDTSAQSRVALFAAQWQMSEANPLGTGHRGTEVLSPQYLDPMYLTRGGARSSHNAAFTVLVEQGWPGLVMMVAMILWVAVTLLRLRTHSRQHDTFEIGAHTAAAGGILAVVLAGGMFADYSKCEVQIWFFAVLASLREIIKLRSATVEPTPTPSPTPTQLRPVQS